MSCVKLKVTSKERMQKCTLHAARAKVAVLGQAGFVNHQERERERDLYILQPHSG